MGLIRILIFLLFPTIALAQGGLQVQCEKAGNQVACTQWEQQKRDAEFARARAAQQSTSTDASEPASVIKLLVGLIFWGGIIYGIVYLFKKARHQVRDEAFDSLPKDGPMKVSIKEEQIPAGSFGSKQFKCALNIKVVVSQNDWHAIANAGLMKGMLFEYPGLSGPPTPDNVRPFLVENLKDGGQVHFHNIMQMQEAKEKLIESLHGLREQIDRQRSGPQIEHIEI
jgi:hypothetical protein